MSSHHVVRENQEPALLIQDFQALDLEFLGQLLEWSPTILCNEESLDYLISEGIKVDVVLTNNASTSVQEHTKIHSFEGDFVENALNYLYKHNHKAVNILSDHFPTCLPTSAQDINIVLFYQEKRFVRVQSKFEKWKPKGERVYVEGKQLKSFQGLSHVGKDIFEVEQDGFVSLEFNTSDFVFIGEDL